MRSPNDVAACPRKPVTDFAHTHTHMYNTIELRYVCVCTAKAHRPLRITAGDATAALAPCLDNKRRRSRKNVDTCGRRRLAVGTDAGLEHPARQQAPTDRSARASAYRPRRLSSPRLFFAADARTLRGSSCVFFYSRCRAVIRHRCLRLSV